MKDTIRFKGHVNVILVMDMKPFIHTDDRQQFETLRGDRAFANVLKEIWPRQLQNSAFKPVDADVLETARSQEMSTDEVGFVTGMFRSNMLDLYSQPVYRVEKSCIQFPESVTKNRQYTQHFAPVWDKWDIYMRPTMTGMMVIRLERKYTETDPKRKVRPVPIISAALNVIKLQTPFDVPDAIKEIKRLEKNLADPKLAPHEHNKQQGQYNGLREFLQWIGVTDIQSPELDYIPVQWQLANELSSQFIRETGYRIQVKDRRPVRFSQTKPDLSTSLYNVYTIYHLDELVADPSMFKRPSGQDGDGDTAAISTQTARAADQSWRPVEVSDIEESIRLKRGLAGLIEGSILQKHDSSALADLRFPTHSRQFIDKIFEHDNTATWTDELCILGSRTAIVMPSRSARNDQLLVSKVAASNTSASVDYTRYWEAFERLVEFVNEISILAQLVENDSTATLQQFVYQLDSTRRNILRGQLNGTLNESQRRLAELTNQSANLSRLVGLCQGLINPNSWSRAEYAVGKANHLIHEMQTPLLVNHAERNVSNLTNLVDHVDELVLAQLSENSNAQNSRQSIILAGLSLSIILFTLPSFWADIDQLNDNTNTIVQAIGSSDLLLALTLLGSILAPFIFIGSFLVALMAGIPMVYRFWRKIQNRRSQNQDLLIEENILVESGTQQYRGWRRLLISSRKNQSL